MTKPKMLAIPITKAQAQLLDSIASVIDDETGRPVTPTLYRLQDLRRLEVATNLLLSESEWAEALGTLQNEADRDDSTTKMRQAVAGLIRKVTKQSENAHALLGEIRRRANGW